MKKTLLLALSTLASFYSCTNDPSELKTDNRIIGFSPYSPITKGTPMNGNADFQQQDNRFGVTAYLRGANSTDPPYIGKKTAGEEVIYNGTIWQYTNMQYWPNKAIDFYAYTPYNLSKFSSTIDVDPTIGLVITPFYVPTDIDEQVDFMYATALNTSKPSNNSNVLLNFKHGLSQIAFKAKTGSSKLKAKIGQIELENIHASAGFMVSNSGTSLWAVGSTKSTYKAKLDHTFININYDPVNYKQISSPNNVLMLIPQTQSTWDPSTEKTKDGTGIKPTTTKPYLKIKCKIFVVNGNKKYYIIGKNGYSANSCGNVYVPISIDWKEGYKYTYNLEFGAGHDADGYPISGPIIFTTDIETWQDTSLKPTM